MIPSDRSPRWPPYPHIPIYLETYGDNGTTRSYNTISTISSPSPEFRPEGGALHALAAATTHCLPPVSPAATQFTNLSPIWPNFEQLPPAHLQPERARTEVPIEKPRVQLHENAPLSPEEPKPRPPPLHRRSKLGLGIDGGSIYADTMPTLSSGQEEGTTSRNFAQRIEERLWRYNLSGNVAKRWLLEIISWCISALCMAVIVGVLIYYRDSKLPRWPGGLTLNAFIAVLSKISGAALILPVSEALGQLKWSWFQGNSKTMWDFEIFDNASRGPWGAFLLLIRTKGKALAAIGALITLFSLALDPFFQQVVDFPERWSLNGTSSIPRVVQYKPSIGIQIKAGQQIALQDQAIQGVAEKFFYDNGTQPVPFGDGERADIPLSCPSSNCTWPSYETLGICSQCMEVPQLLTFGCFNTTFDWVANQTGFPGFQDNTTSGEMCGYFLNATNDGSSKQSPVLMSGYAIDAFGKPGEALLTRLLPLTTNPDRKALYGGSINFKHVRNPIIDALIVGAVSGPASVYGNIRPVAHECVVSWCVKTIRSSYYLATYKEEVTNTFINTTDGPFPWAVTTITKSPGLNSTDMWYLLNSNVSITAPLDGKTASWYGVTNDTAFATTFTFDDIFPSFITTANISAKPFMRYKVAQRGPLLRDLSTNPWVSNNITHHMERLATALTNVIRSSNSNEMVSGDAYDRENYVFVRWIWLALPLGLLLLTLIFLVATIRKTSKEREQIGIWKTSALATLLYGLPDHYQERIANRTSLGTPRAKAKKLKVKLLPTKGWRVSGGMISPVTPNPSIPHPVVIHPVHPSSQAPPGWI